MQGLLDRVSKQGNLTARFFMLFWKELREGMLARLLRINADSCASS